MPGLPYSTQCSSYAATTVVLPANTGKKNVSYRFRLEVIGQRTAHAPPVSATVSTAAAPTPVGPGTASLTYNGVVSGQLLNAMSYCQPLPSGQSEITVNGTLSGTPWVLYVQSYDGESGAGQVVTGQAGGGTGIIGQGYAVDGTYPASVSGVTQINWSEGATLDVQLTSGPGQTPTGNIEVQGTINCG